MMAAVFFFFGAVAVCFITVAAVGFIRMGSASDGMCAPSRRANITASKPQARRRVMVQLGPPAGWREPAIAPAAVAYAAPTPEQIAAAVCTPSRYDALTMQRQFSHTYDLAVIEPPAAVPELPQEPPGIPVEWPTRVVQPVPLSRR